MSLSTATTTAPAGHVPPPAAAALASHDAARPVGPSWHARYVIVLTWTFTLFSTVRAVSYLPTLWAICASGDSSQHSLWTWGAWLGSNLSMALWLHEQHGQRWTRAAVVSLVNAAMCAATLTVILVYRF